MQTSGIPHENLRPFHHTAHSLRRVLHKLSPGEECEIDGEIDFKLHFRKKREYEPGSGPSVERAVAQVATWRGRHLKLRYRATRARYHPAGSAHSTR